MEIHICRQFLCNWLYSCPLTPNTNINCSFDRFYCAENPSWVNFLMLNLGFSFGLWLTKSLNLWTLLVKEVTSDMQFCFNVKCLLPNFFVFENTFLFFSYFLIQIMNHGSYAIYIVLLWTYVYIVPSVQWVIYQTREENPKKNKKLTEMQRPKVLLD